MPPQAKGVQQAGMTKKASMATAAIVTLFLILALEAALFKGLPILQPNWSGHPFDNPFAPSLAWRPNFRLMASLIGLTLQQVFTGLTALAHWNVEAAWLYDYNPWPINPAQDQVAGGLLVPVASYLTFVVLMLAPLLVLALSWTRSLIGRSVLLLVLFGAILGWHPSVVSLFFRLGSLVADWPRSFYLYADMLRNHDWAAIGFMGIMALYIARCRDKTWPQIVVLTVLAQLTFEHLGLVFGVALAVHAFWATGRADAVTALRRLVLVGVVAMTVAAIAAAIFTLKGSKVSTGAGLSMADYVRLNFAWYKIVIANTATMTLLAGGAGLLGGLIGWCFEDHGEQARWREDALAALGLVVGGLIVVGLGFFTASYPSEMGRQLTPLALCMVMLGYRGGQLALNRAIRR